MNQIKAFSLKNKTLFSLLLILLSLDSFSIDTLKWYTEDYPPFNFKVGKSSKVEGIAVELLEATHKRLYKNRRINKKVLRKDYRLIPWARAYRKALKKRAKNAVFSTTRTEKRELQFKWFGPIAKNTNVLFALKNHATLKKNEIKQAIMSGKVTGIKGDAGLAFVKNLGVSNKYIVNAYSPLQMFNLLKKRKVKYLAYGKLTTFHLMKKLKMDFKAFKVVHTLAESELWFALNKFVSEKTVKTYQKTLESVKRDNRELKEKLLGEFNLKIEDTKLRNSLFGKGKCPHKKTSCGKW